MKKWYYLITHDEERKVIKTTKAIAKQTAKYNLLYFKIRADYAAKILLAKNPSVENEEKTEE